jgi:phosphomannomutase
MTISDVLIQEARAWMSQDPDPETRAELEALIETQDLNEIEKRFSSRIGFGTAGLRGELGAGPNRMNRVLVSQAAAGLGEFLVENFTEPAVVIGYDARKNSDVFARDSAEILSGLGIKTFLFESLAATPLLAFAVRELGCSAGVMVTASHNPPGDNGYKVYEASGSQIVSPVDKQISEKIEHFSTTRILAELKRSEDYIPVPAEVRSRYASLAAALYRGLEGDSELKILYSAMHGIGSSFIREIFELAGLPKLFEVQSQAEPDGKFPTVAFPNPEEPGAMDQSLETAAAIGADLILVNDPDADRLAVSFRQADGTIRSLSGDELGLLLGEEIARRTNEAGKNGALACSIVSGAPLKQVAEHYGLDYQETLTGFKWISRVENLVFGYEEALGYCVDPENVGDKDGLSAAVVVTDIAIRLAKAGSNLEKHLEELSNRYGHVATGQISIRVEDLSVIRELMKKIRSSPPAAIAGVETTFTDLSLGTERLAPTDGLRFDLADGRRVIVRPSGTEPKLKCYLLAKADSTESAKAQLESLREAMKELLS